MTIFMLFIIIGTIIGEIIAEKENKEYCRKRREYYDWFYGRNKEVKS